MATRREWLVYTGLTGLAAATGTLARSAAAPIQGAIEGADAPPGHAAAEPDPDVSPGDATPEAPPPWWALSPLREGSALAAGWSLASLSPVREGRAVLELAHEDGARAEVHMRRRGSREAAGLAQSERFDFFLMNGSRGDEETREVLGRLILGLALHVRRNELDAPEELMASFTAHRETGQRTSRA